MCSEASTGVGLGGCGIFSRLLARASLFFPRKIEFKGLVTDYKTVLSSGARTPRFRISSETYKICCKINFKSTLIGEQPGQSKGSGRPRQLSVCSWQRRSGCWSSYKRTHEGAYTLHGQQISSRLEMGPKMKLLAKAHALFYKGLEEVGGNESKINDVNGNFRSVSI